MFSGPGFFSLDLTLFKEIRITERTGLQLRLETFSVTTPNFNPTCCTSNNANFGVVRSVIGSGRGVITAPAAANATFSWQPNSSSRQERHLRRVPQPGGAAF